MLKLLPRPHFSPKHSLPISTYNCLPDISPLRSHVQFKFNVFKPEPSSSSHYFISLLSSLPRGLSHPPQLLRLFSVIQFLTPLQPRCQIRLPLCTFITLVHICHAPLFLLGTLIAFPSALCLLSHRCILRA